MSGGSFGYVYHRVEEFAKDLEYAIETEELKLKGETVEALRNIVDRAKSTAAMMKAVEYLYSHDTDEETFMKAVKEIV